jgi:hypothetical protein
METVKTDTPCSSARRDYSRVADVRIDFFSVYQLSARAALTVNTQRFSARTPFAPYLARI